MARKDEMTIFREQVAAMPESAARKALEALPEAFQQAGRARLKVIRERLLQIDGLDDGAKVALANLLAAKTRKAFRLTCSNADGEATINVLVLGQALGAITQRKLHYGLVLSYLGRHPNGAYGLAFAGLLQQGAQAVGRLAVLLELERVTGPGIAGIYGARLIDVEFDAKAAIEHILAPQEVQKCH
jgi:hypothetical protein